MNGFSRTLPFLTTLLIPAFFLTSCSKKEPEIETESQLQATIETSMGTIVAKLYEEKTPKTVANFVGLADGSRLLDEGADPATAKPFYDGLTFHRVIPDFMIQGGCPNGDGSGGPGYDFEDETYALGEPITGPIADQETAEYVFEQLILPHLRQHRGKSPIESIATLFGEMQKANGFTPMLEMSVEEITSALGYEGELRSRGELLGSVDYGKLCMANAGPNTNGSQFFIVTKKDGCPWLNGKHTVFGEVISGMEVAEAIQGVGRGPADKPLEPVIIQSIRVNRVDVPVEPESDVEVTTEVAAN